MCVNPCIDKKCGQNAKCKIENHVPKCFCPSGFHGDPNKKCSKGKNT